MRRVVSAIVAGILAASLSACGPDHNSPDGDKSSKEWPGYYTHQPDKPSMGIATQPAPSATNRK